MRMLIVVLLSASVPALAQVQEAWVARYNGPGDGVDGARAIVVDDAWYVYVTGWSQGSGTGPDFATVKYSPDGEELWVARYNGPGNGVDGAKALAVDDAGNVYVTGYSDGSGTFRDYATIKYGPDGEELWVRRYNGPGNVHDQPNALALDNSGNIYVTGESWGSGTDYDYATIKYSPDGDEVWVRRYNGPADAGDAAWALALDSAGNVLVTGWSVGPGTSGDYATIKYSPDGDELWVSRYNGPGNDFDYAEALAVDATGNVFVTGGSHGSGTDWDYATIKYSPAGEELWVARYNGSADSTDRAYRIGVDATGNVYVTGWSWGGWDDSGTGYDYATIKYSPDGEELWVRKYDGPGIGGDQAYALALDGVGNVYVTGASTGSGTHLDYATIKYSPDGEELWVTRYNGPGNSNDWAFRLAVDGAGNVYATGRSGGSGTDDDYATIKYVQDVAVAEDRPVPGPVPGFSLDDGSPNPFSSRVTIRYSLPAGMTGSFRIYDASGRLVRTLPAGSNTPGAHTVTWDGRDEQGRNLSTGVYLARLTTGDFTATRKIVKTE